MPENEVAWWIFCHARNQLTWQEDYDPATKHVTRYSCIRTEAIGVLIDICDVDPSDRLPVYDKVRFCESHCNRIANKHQSAK